jgi:hypothetical protein
MICPEPRGTVPDQAELASTERTPMAYGIFLSEESNEFVAARRRRTRVGV